MLDFQTGPGGLAQPLVVSLSHREPRSGIDARAKSPRQKTGRGDEKSRTSRQHYDRAMREQPTVDLPGRRGRGQNHGQRTIVNGGLLGLDMPRKDRRDADVVGHEILSEALCIGNEAGLGSTVRRSVCCGEAGGESTHERDVPAPSRHHARYSRLGRVNGAEQIGGDKALCLFRRFQSRFPAMAVEDARVRHDQIDGLPIVCLAKPGRDIGRVPHIAGMATHLGATCPSSRSDLVKKRISARQQGEGVAWLGERESEGSADSGACTGYRDMCGVRITVVGQMYLRRDPLQKPRADRLSPVRSRSWDGCRLP